MTYDFESDTYSVAERRLAFHERPPAGPLTLLIGEVNCVLLRFGWALGTYEQSGHFTLVQWPAHPPWRCRHGFHLYPEGCCLRCGYRWHGNHAEPWRSYVK